jgi:hypothetical protein
MGDASLAAQLLSPATPLWIMVIGLVGWAVKTWPVWKGKINEARKIELDADGVLRRDLLTRISELERTRTTDREYFDNQLAGERRRCDEELEKMREENRGLVAMIRQHSQSSAMLMGDPAGMAITSAARKRRGEDEQT